MREGKSREDGILDVKVGREGGCEVRMMEGQKDK